MNDERAENDLSLPRYKALRDMLSLARAILSDRHVSDAEAQRLLVWMESHPDLLGVQAVEELISCLREYFADGRLSEKQRTKLTKLLHDLAGEDEQ